MFDSPPRREVSKVFVLHPGELRRYLDVLQVGRQEPSLAALEELVAAHLTRVPFENVSKLFRVKRTGMRRIPNLDDFLAGIEQCHFGGTCYSNNYYLYKLLQALNYEVKLCGADMSRPDVHLAIVVQLDGREYLVDVGYGAPFLVPIPRDLAKNFEISLGADRYVFEPQDAEGRTRMEVYHAGAMKHGYVLKPEARPIEDFHQVITDSYKPDAVFMNTVMLVRFWPARSVMIRDSKVSHAQGSTTSEQTLSGRAELIEAIEHYFEMPRALVNQALRDLPEQPHAVDQQTSKSPSS